MTNTTRMIRQAEGFLDAHKIYEARPNQRRRVKDPIVSCAQLRNLLAAAESGASIPVLANFLRHQMSRGRDGWSHRKSGDALIKTLEKDIAPDAGGSAEAESALAARFLGYLIRHYNYKCLGAGTHGRDH